MLKLSYEKCVCFIFLVILVFLSCSGFHTDRLVTLTDHNKKYPFTSSSSSHSLHLNAQFDRSELVMMRSGAAIPTGSGPWDRDRELENSRRRRHARRRRPRRPRFCPGQDVASRAFRAHVVIEGVVRSKRHLPTNSSAADYNVTVEVKRIHRNDSHNLTGIIRLKFANRQHKGCEDKRVNGLVPAKLSNGESYIFFLDSAGTNHYTVLSQPVPLPTDPQQRKFIEKQIRNIVVRKKVKPAKIVSLKSSNTNVKFNENVTLTCEVRGNPPPVIKWYRNGTELRRRKQENIRIKHVKRNSTLTIQNFSWSDSAIYECRAKGVTGGPVSENVTISLPHEFSSEVTECDSPSKEYFCLNGGLCVQIKSMKEVACKCLTGFTGRRCENKDISSQTSTYSRSQTCTLGLSNSFYC